MATIQKKSVKRAMSGKKAGKSSVSKVKSKREIAIEKAISFWKDHAVDLINFSFDRTEANAR